MKTLTKVASYLKVLAKAKSLEEAKREATLALRVIEKEDAK
ncbi:hypothetical protein [Phaeobacter sp. 11ANDIMAR09]|nr:hypothetical protein [Phaeobacter sp. 11ANDIMAR09]